MIHLLLCIPHYTSLRLALHLNTHLLFSPSSTGNSQMKTSEHHNWLIIPWHCWLVVAVRCQCWDTGTMTIYQWQECHYRCYHQQHTGPIHTSITMTQSRVYIYSGEYSLSILYNGCDIVICDVGWRGLLWNVAERLDTRRFNAQRFVKINNSATVLRCLSPVRSLLKILSPCVSPLSCRVLQTPQLISKSSRDIRISFLQSENITRTLRTQECMDRLVDSLCWHSIDYLNWIWYSFREEIGSRNKIFKYFTLFIKSVNVNKVLASHV